MESWRYASDTSKAKTLTVTLIVPELEVCDLLFTYKRAGWKLLKIDPWHNRKGRYWLTQTTVTFERE